LYGVYIFFVLSGASMTIAYGRRFEGGFPVARYLAQRYLRLAPLFALVTLYVVLVELRLHGASTTLALKFVENVTFAFGVMNPGTTALATGAWSLGIEFVFYLVFPLLAALRGRPLVLGLVALASMVLQLLFVHLTLGESSLELRWAEYTQFGSFVGYFVAGVALGASLERGATTAWAWVPFLGLSAVIALGSGPDATTSLIGARGVLLAAASVALVAVAGRLTVPRALVGVSAWLGDISYALYLLHPLVFGAVASRHLLQASQADSPRRFVAVALVASLALSTVVYLLFEKRVLAWGKRRLATFGS
jgi:peptidoglycan/LPS O-acetylase OafA/YrhL